MKKISIIGASGKTGSKILEALLKNKNLNSFVQFAIVSEKSNFLNQDVFSHLKIQNENNKALSFSCNIETALRNSDIIIDFSSHKLSEAMIENYFEKLELSSKKFIIGTTPFEYKKLKKFDEFIEKNLLFYSPNMSILIGILAGFLEKYSDFFSQNYDIGINEIHHVHKKDSPSGTAKLLVNKLQKNQSFQSDEKNKIQISSMKISEIFGIHEIFMANQSEIFEIKHQALNRDLFSDGVLKILNWIIDQNKSNGFYEMKDFLNSIES